ncbi:hypothetical protein GV827_21680 [Sulfitobacter sp. JBTF-M27]|uniref:Dirigent protein n=1 Tax=Sulfitobacter sediminilitoris TaxID=2698830 RepID=A0A6P0CKC3_9RHOB|nr:dirigent protein [Sulfitobacter sediminilitoris]NEK24983.1 hypothetical protein [Sulfitobacter sediminilitoris]
MKPSVFYIALAGFLGSGPVFAEDRIELNTIYPLNQEYFQLSDSIYYMQDNRGYFEVVDGPLEEGPARCVGGGFGAQNGENSIQGVCVFGAGEDTFTMRWKAGEQGGANTWSIVGGTGKFDGMTGEGIATTGVEIMYKAMPLRQSHIVGMVNIPDH